MKKIVLQILYSVFGRLFLKLIVGVKFSDNQFLKNEEQFIIVANHNSHLDTFTILSSLPKSIIDKVKPIAAKDYFGKTKLTAKISNYFVNTLLISRNKDDKEYKNPIEEMLKAIDNGNSLVLFPEGTRGEAEKMEDIKKGIAILLLERPNIKYVPVYMSGMGKSMPKGDALLIPHNSSIIYGKPSQIKSDNVGDILLQIKNDIIGLAQ